MSAKRYPGINKEYSIYIREIDSPQLYDTNATSMSAVGRGSFAVVKVKSYRDILVAVKEFSPGTVLEDVLHEALMLSSLSHNNLPMLFGMCHISRPYKIVMQFYGFHLPDGLVSLTVRQELVAHNSEHITTAKDWILLSIHLLRAMTYIHECVGILHNNVKTNNMVITGSKNDPSLILIDFGSASKITESHKLHLTDSEKQDYYAKYPHIPSEVIEGDHPPSIYSDTFAVGKVLISIGTVRHFLMLTENLRACFSNTARKCIVHEMNHRPLVKDILNELESLMFELG